MNAPIRTVYRYCSISKGNPADCVKWAEAALCENFDSPSLRIMTGLDVPLNFFEVKEYTEAALQKLGIEIPSGTQAVSAYAKDISRDFINHQVCLKSNNPCFNGAPETAAR